MVVIPGEPPGKQLCSFLRGLCRSRSKLIVVGESGGLGPGDLLALLRCQLPDVTNFEVIDMTEVHGESVAEAIDACQSQGIYKNGQALEVFCSPENARSFATEIRSGHLDVDPTVITVHPQQIPSDDKNLITRAVMSGDKQELAQALDPHIMSDPEEVGRYREIILGEAAWPQPDVFTEPPKLPEIVVPAGTVLYHGTSSAKDFSIPRGPASFTPSVKVAKYYADHEGEGVRPRVLKFKTTKPIRCLDHPGAMDDGKAQYWLQRFAIEKLGWSPRGASGWDMVGYARMPGFLQFVKKAGFQGLRLEALDSGGVEVCVFDPNTFVEPVQNESLHESAGNIQRLLQIHPIIAKRFHDLFGAFDFPAAKLVASCGTYDNGMYTIELPKDLQKLPDDVAKDSSYHKDFLGYIMGAAFEALQDTTGIPAENFSDENDAAQKIIRFFKENPKIIPRINSAKLGEETLRIAQEQLMAGKRPSADLKSIVDLPGGWRFVDLEGNSDAVEAAEMQHCGRDGRGTLVSLRDPQNNAHVTMTYNKDNNVVWQIKGKQNSIPVEKYWPAIRQFFAKTKADLKDDDIKKSELGQELGFEPPKDDYDGVDYDFIERHLVPRESLVREFLVDIAPSRDVAIQVLHDLLAAKLQSAGMDIQSAEYLGSGRNGSAYRLPDGLILKVTTDPAEAESGRKLVGQPTEYIHLIHGVTQLSERVWLLAQEGGLQKLPPEYSDELDTTVEALEAIGAGHALREGDWQQVVDCIENCSDPGIVPLLWEVIERFGIEGMCHEVRRFGLSADIHSGNIMLREGIPILTDLGTPGDPPSMNEMAYFHASDALQGLKHDGWVDANVNAAIGEGHFGMVFPSKNQGRVVKVTEDEDEYRNAKRLRGKNLPGIAKVFNFDVLTSRDPLYVIELEALEPIDDHTQDVIDKVAYRISSKIGRGGDAELQSWQQEDPKIAEIIISARKAGFVPDIHGGNIMKRSSGELVLADLGPVKLHSTANEGRLDELLKDIGGEEGARQILQKQEQLLSTKGINVGNLQKLGQGQMGVAFRIGNGKVLKVSTDKAEVDTAMTLLGKNPRHVVGYHDIFPLQENVWGLITDECMKLSQQEEYDIMDVAERLRDDRVIDDVATKNWNAVVSAVTAAVTEDARGEGAGLSKIDGIVNRIMADFLTKAKRYQFPEMIDELRSLGVQFADYKPENIMKKSGRYVIVDLSMSKSGNNGIGEAVGVQAGPMAGTGQTLKGAGSSAWSGGRGTLADPVNHVPEDENETEQDRSLDWGFYGTSLR